MILLTLINIIVINKPNKCRQIGIFPNDLGDHCAIRIIQLVKILNKLETALMLTIND